MYNSLVKKIVLMFSLFFILIINANGKEKIIPTYIGKPNVLEEKKTFLIKPDYIEISCIDIDPSLTDEQKIKELFNQMTFFSKSINKEELYSLEEGVHEIIFNFDNHKQKELKIKSDPFKIQYQFEAGKTYTIYWETLPGKNAFKMNIKVWIDVVKTE